MQQLKFFGSQKYFNHLYGKEIEKLGKSNTGEKYLSITNRYSSRRPGYFRVENPFYRSPESIQKAATEEVTQKFEELGTSLTEDFQQQKSEIAEQLKILQENKSAYEQMQKDYRRMIRKDTKAKEKAIEKRREALQIARANAARATAGGGLQIQYGGGVTPSAGGLMPRMGGTSQFKTRQSSMVNI